MFLLPSSSSFLYLRIFFSLAGPSSPSSKARKIHILLPCMPDRWYRWDLLPIRSGHPVGLRYTRGFNTNSLGSSDDLQIDGLMPILWESTVKHCKSAKFRMEEAQVQLIFIVKNSNPGPLKTRKLRFPKCFRIKVIRSAHDRNLYFHSSSSEMWWLLLGGHSPEATNHQFFGCFLC